MEAILKIQRLFSSLFYLSFVLFFNCLGMESTEERAIQASLALKETLQNKLKEKILEGGPLNAIEFCNLNAFPLTEEVSKKYNLQIRRISDRPRNPRNQASPGEIQIMNEMRSDIKAGINIANRRISTKENNHILIPIRISENCLVCHGEKGNTIPKQVEDKIKILYPNDLAIGYKVSDLRGLFVVSIPK